MVSQTSGERAPARPSERRAWVAPGAPVNQLAAVAESRIRLWFALLTALTAYLGAWGSVAAMFPLGVWQAVQHDDLDHGWRWSERVVDTVAPEVLARVGWSRWVAIAIAFGVAVSALAYLTDSVRFGARFLQILGRALLGPFTHYFRVLDSHQAEDGLTPAEDRADLREVIEDLRGRAALRFDGEVHLWAAAGNDQPAFTFGNHRGAHVCLGPDLLNEDPRALRVRAILAHELAHVASGDLPLLAFVEGLTRTLPSLGIVVVAGVALTTFSRAPGARGFGFAFGLGLALCYATLFALARLLQTAAVRQREFDADAVAAMAFDDVGPVASALEHGLPDEALEPAETPRGVARLFSSHPDVGARVQHLEHILSGIPPARGATIVAAGLGAMLGPGAMFYALFPLLAFIPTWLLVSAHATLAQITGGALLLLMIRPGLELTVRHAVMVIALFSVGQLMGWALVGLPNVLSGHDMGEVSAMAIVLNSIVTIGYTFALRTLLPRSPSPWHFRSTTKTLIAVFTLAPTAALCAALLAGARGVPVKYALPGVIAFSAVVPLAVRLIWRARCQVCGQTSPARRSAWTFETARTELCGRCGSVPCAFWFQAEGDEYGTAHAGSRDHAVVRVLRPLALATLFAAFVCTNASLMTGASRAMEKDPGTPNAKLAAALIAAQGQSGEATSRCSTLTPLGALAGTSVRLFANELSGRFRCPDPLPVAAEPTDKSPLRVPQGAEP